MNISSILNEYINFRNEYISKYGENTLVLLQNGTFFEIYAVINDNEEIGEINIYEICQSILGIVVSKRNKKIKEITRQNFLQAGFGVDYIAKYLKMLLNNNYTVVLVRQVTEKPNIERKATEIYSPGTYIENYNNNDTNYLMSVYIEKYECYPESRVNAGVSMIDLSTGECYLHDISNYDKNYWKDEISRYINYYNPSECLFQTNNYELTKENITHLWDITHDSIQIDHYNDDKFINIFYQNELLQKVYQLKNMITPIEYFNLENTNELRLSFIYLLNYVYEHKLNILQNISHPEQIKDTNYLTLTSNSIRQLNVINNYSYYKGKNESLLAVCNHCKTPMGRRLFKQRLLYPAINTEILEKRYDLIDLYRDSNNYKKYVEHLRKVVDLEKYLRKIGLNILQPNELFTCYLSYEFINKLLNLVNDNERLKVHYEEYKNSILFYQKFFQDITNTFKFDNFSSIHQDRSYFNPGIFIDIDNIDKSIQDNLNDLKNICDKLSTILKKNGKCKQTVHELIKYEYNEKNQWYLTCTKPRGKLLISLLKSPIKINENITIETVTCKVKDSSKVILECPEIKKISNNLIQNQKKLDELNKKYWSETLERLYSTYSISLQQFHKLLAEIDVSCTGASISLDYKYTRPIIKESEKSYLSVKEIRHPIVEQINTQSEYITNDVDIGKNNSDGILLYGTNACGKSTLMKSIGLTIIMAQAGLFVPCSYLEFKPYTQIFTRILNNDNIFKSQSTFAVEVSELRNIFNQCDENSLVLGDELCSGTETLSAISIVTQSIHEFIKKKCSFLLTSHLHQLTELKLIKSLKNLKIYHLRILIENGILIYDRKLEPGSGPSVYGLTVCEAMGMNSDFILNSKKILSELENKSTKIVDTKSSHYNSNIFMDCCKVCSNKAEETHHIKEQELADETNHINHFHKNNMHNLVPLCKSCHQKVTHGNLIIEGYTDTSNGIILNYHYINDKIKKRKFLEKDIQIIKKYNHIFKLSKKNCKDLLELNENIKISLSTLNKIMNDQY